MRSVRSRGVTLIELLVAMVIGLVVTLAVTSVVSLGESHKRSTTSTNDMAQTGAFAAYQLDRVVRSAGSGFIQSWAQGSVGCKLNVASMLPRTTAFPAPFNTAFLTGNTANLRLAPVLIAKSQSDAGSDVLVVMSGQGSAGDVPRRNTDPGTATTLRLDNTVGISVNDLLLVHQAGTADCLVEQVSAVAAKTLTLAGTYYTAGTSTTLASLSASTSTYLSVFGNASAQNVQFHLYGVGANRTLFNYDLLRSSGTDVSQAVADGVVELRALYGMDMNDDGILDSWADPGATGYDINTVMTTPATLRHIIAVRVALVLRSSNRERDIVSGAKLKMFADQKNAAGASLARELTLASDDRYYRYRVIETTIPVRNMLLMPAL